MKTVALITPTGGRHQAFALCERWIKNQTYRGPLKWYVVDDCPYEPTEFTMGQTKCVAPKVWNKSINTHRYNMDSLLSAVKGDYVFIIEDDEYYAPTYIEEMLKLLSTAQIAGISNDRYYHIKAKGHKLIGNWKHASLCRTALRAEALSLLYEAVHSGEYYFDIDLWRRVRDREVPLNLIANSGLSIGIKGMPGRAGLGAGHVVVGYGNDKTLTVFKEWLGSDWEHYREFLK